jgi:hypothetical protein
MFVTVSAICAVWREWLWAVVCDCGISRRRERKPTSMYRHDIKVSASTNHHSVQTSATMMNTIVTSDVKYEKMPSSSRRM